MRLRRRYSTSCRQHSYDIFLVNDKSAGGAGLQRTVDKSRPCTNIFSLDYNERPRPYAHCCAAHTGITILLLYSPPESLSVSRSTTAQTITISIIHAHTRIVVILLLILCASSRVKNLIVTCII